MHMHTAIKGLSTAQHSTAVDTKSEYQCVCHNNHQEYLVDQAVIAYISVGVAFLTFVGIVTYHAYLQIKPWTPQDTFCCIKSQDKKSDLDKFDNAQNHVHKLQTWSKTPPTTTFVEIYDLRRPLDMTDTN